MCVLGGGVDYKELAHAITEADKSKNQQRCDIKFECKGSKRTRKSQRPSWKAELSLIREGQLFVLFKSSGY